jgi:hypothetical protein
MAGGQAPDVAPLFGSGISEVDAIRNGFELGQIALKDAQMPREAIRQWVSDNVAMALRYAGPTGRSSDGVLAWDLIPKGAELTMDQVALLDESARRAGATKPG